jgi:SAM-dependent methyltransferase
MRAPERARRLDAAYFDELYLRQRDPWGFETSPYERRKYLHTLAAIGPSTRRVGRALEVGCSIGVFTERLSRRCDELLAVDASIHAVERARERLRDAGNVRVERRELPEELPAGPWDLIVCSEVLYYWDAELLRATLPALVAELAEGGSLLAVHWRPETQSYPLLGDEVHDLLARDLGELVHARSATRSTYRLDRWDRPA